MENPFEPVKEEKRGQLERRWRVTRVRETTNHDNPLSWGDLTEEVEGPADHTPGAISSGSRPIEEREDVGCASAKRAQRAVRSSAKATKDSPSTKSIAWATAGALLWIW